ncbi:hypothetical protein J5N97_028036 [Dioscorea zingiberensis]|uniref:Uncharacterized protein n=1 Tax=Dioscorea zingiberensis TaxID=325984 RepID=A0A9D5H4I6_9LILI|nr:hypothetical protein J5N97_028036 [Dioscorea zingiberensis]
MGSHKQEKKKKELLIKNKKRGSFSPVSSSLHFRRERPKLRRLRRGIPGEEKESRRSQPPITVTRSCSYPPHLRQAADNRRRPFPSSPCSRPGCRSELCPPARRAQPKQPSLPHASARRLLHSISLLHQHRRPPASALLAVTLLCSDLHESVRCSTDPTLSLMALPKETDLGPPPMRCRRPDRD